MRFGDWTVDPIVENGMKVDGGALFGVIPKKLWSRLESSDEANMVALNTNVYLLRRGSDAILIDTGMGDLMDEKTRKIYQPTGTSRLAEGMAQLDISREKVTHVIFTHLHWDHLGGAFIPGPEREIVPHFPEAVHWVQEAEWQAALHPDERTASAYPAPLLKALSIAKLQRADGPCEILPGLSVEPTGGHSGGHQMVHLTDGNRQITFGGDMFPTRHHLRIPWIAAVDIHPMTALEVKRRFWGDSAAGERYLALDHDTTARILRLRKPTDDPPYEVME